MARARRTRFAAPLVIVVAAGCSHRSGGIEINGKRAQRAWSIHGMPEGCHAEEWNSCPDEPDLHCNPPPPIDIACPPGAATDGTAKIVSYDGTHCVLVGPETPIECPAFKAPPDAAVAAIAPPDAGGDAAAVAASLRQWSVQRRPDGTCEAFDDPCSRMQRAPGDPIPPCNPPAPQPIACPPHLKTSGTIVEESAGTCVYQPPPQCPPGAKCPTLLPVTVACPP